MAERRPLLSVKNLSYNYQDGSIALNEVSFELFEDEKIALVGANGSGKSTLLLHLSGCFAAGKGEIFFKDNDAGGNTSILMAAAGLVFQEPDDQMFMPSVLDDVTFGLAAGGVNAKTARETAYSCLEMLGASHLAERPPHRMSGGEKRISALAGILVMRPEIILLDEPTSGLDPAARRRVIEILKDMDKPMILATHDLDMALDLCGRTLILHKGTITASGETRQILCDEKLLRANGLALPMRYADGVK
ncbi:putative ABC transporter ATP-binding protein [Synergistales bacterium]|nr:putative ABC transporter ATP-binding protein [Synergistales bacterium]